MAETRIQRMDTDASIAQSVTAGVIVAHPDDEALWVGGMMLLHPQWQWHIFTLCRANDADRAPRFQQALRAFGAHGGMADLDDGPEQLPLASQLLEDTALSLVGTARFTHLFTHGPEGEYTRHRRHEEVSRAVASLWCMGRLAAAQLHFFAYEDGEHAYQPRPRTDAHWQLPLSADIWAAKYRIVCDIYGFSAESWEALTTPRQEAFWSFASPAELSRWRLGREVSW